MAALHISISAEKLFTLGGVEVTNSMVSSLIVSLFLIGFAALARTSITKTNKPTGIQNLLELIVEALYNLIHSVTGDVKRTRFFFPILASFFFFILFNNWSGLLPGMHTIGILHESSEEHASNTLIETAHAATIETTEDHSEVTLETEQHADTTTTESHGEAKSHTVFTPIFRAGTADLNMTIALGLVSVFLTQVIGVKFLGLAYFKKYLNLSSPINFYVGILETISEFAKIISFAFRLFGNIFAGEVLLVVIGALVPVIVPMPFYGLEIFVGFIQALVFTMLSLVFFNMATHGHDDH